MSNIKQIIEHQALDILDTYSGSNNHILYLKTKKETNKNIEENKISSDDIPFKKSYLFHDGKGFWRHLIDWNSFKEQ